MNMKGSTFWALFSMITLIAFAMLTQGCQNKRKVSQKVEIIDTLRIASLDSLLDPKVLSTFSKSFNIDIELVEFVQKNFPEQLLNSEKKKPFHLFFTPSIYTQLLVDSVGLAPIESFFDAGSLDEANYFNPPLDSLSPYRLNYYFAFAGFLTNWKHVKDLLGKSWYQAFMYIAEHPFDKKLLIDPQNQSLDFLFATSKRQSIEKSQRGMAKFETEVPDFLRKRIVSEGVSLVEIVRDTLLSGLVWSYQANRVVSKNRSLLFVVPDDFVLIENFDLHISNKVTDTLAVQQFLRFITQNRSAAANTTHSQLANVFEESWAFVGPLIMKGPSYQFPISQEVFKRLPQKGFSNFKP